jgi:hypothetical protein
MRSQDGNSTPKWGRHQKSGWELYLVKEKQGDETGFDRLASAFLLADPRRAVTVSRPRGRSVIVAGSIVFLEGAAANFLPAPALFHPAPLLLRYLLARWPCATYSCALPTWALPSALPLPSYATLAQHHPLRPDQTYSQNAQLKLQYVLIKRYSRSSIAII